MIEFEIPGDPVAKQRPRMTKSGHVYTPTKTREYEKLVKEAYISNSRGWKYDKDVPLEVRIIAYFPIPKSDSKKRKSEKKRGMIRPTIKSDIDNICKSVLDGLNGVAYADDKQIVSLHASKWYAENPSVKVIIAQSR